MGFVFLYMYVMCIDKSAYIHLRNSSQTHLAIYYTHTHTLSNPLIYSYWRRQRIHNFTPERLRGRLRKHVLAQYHHILSYIFVYMTKGNSHPISHYSARTDFFGEKQEKPLLNVF